MTKPKDTKHYFTPEEVTFIKKNCIARSFRELTVLFNKRFSLSLSVDQIKSAMSKRGLKNGNNGCFPPGHVPHNKGMKGIRVSIATEFKKGNRPANYMPVGSERINGDGYIDVKVSDPNKWTAKHRIIYEQIHGPIPKGSIIIFADGNKLNIEPDNLLLVTRGELAVMNRSGLIFADGELTRSGLLVARLKMKITKSQRRAS